MDDETLNRLAIEEIVREINEAKARELNLTSERKLNPLAKPNKTFLGRTINSMLTHNKRQNDIKRENCRKKLMDLDDRRLHKNNSKKEIKERPSRTRRKSVSSRLTLSSSSRSRSRRNSKSSNIIKRRDRSKSRRSSSSSDCERRKWKKKLKIKTRKRKSRSKRRSSHSSSEANTRREYFTHRQYNPEDEELEELIEQRAQYYDHSVSNCYEEANIHYSNIAAAYNQMHQFYQYSSMLASVATMNPNVNPCVTKTTNVLPSIEDRRANAILSPTSSSSKSSSLSISLSSLEEDENGVLTINVSSDNEDDGERERNSKSRNVITDDSAEALILSGSSDSSNDAGNVCINLESESCKEDSDSDSSDDCNSSVEILSQSSESKKNVETEEKEPLIEENLATIDSTKAMIDLTED